MMLRRLRQVMGEEKGQSLTEWALVALFAVGMFFFFRESSLLSQVKNTYEQAGSYLSSTPTAEQALTQYGTIANSELRQVDNEQRIAMDRQTLENIAGAFLGKSKAEIRAMLRTAPNFSTYKPERGLDQGNLLFDYYIKGTGDDGAVKTVFDNGVVAKDNLLNWMEGNYTTFPSDQKKLESASRYFYSDDLIDPSGVLNGTEHQAGEYAASVRCFFFFAQDGTVNEVKIWATRNKLNTETNKWIWNDTTGLVDITVTK